MEDTYILTQDATHHFVERARITAQQRKFYEFQTADFDGDSLQDLYLGSSQFDTIPITWYRQLANGGFAGQLGMPVGPITVFVQTVTVTPIKSPQTADCQPAALPTRRASS